MNTLASPASKAPLSSPNEPSVKGPALIAVRIFKFFASLKLAILVLVTLIGVLSAGTFIESAHGAEAAKILIYEAPWFAAVLFFLAMNLACAALDRLPWKIRHIGFCLTHLGIIMILFGSFVTQQMMIDGQMAVEEGKSEHQIILTHPVLYVFSHDEERTWYLDLPRQAFPWKGKKDLGQSLPFNLELQEYFPKALRSEKIISSSSGNPAVKILMKNSFVEERTWLVQNDLSRSEMQMGPVRLLFTQDLLQETADEKAPENPYLEFQFKEKIISLPIPPDLKLPSRQKLKGTDYEINILRVIRHGVVEGKTLLENDPEGKGPGKNPAVEFLLIGPNLEEKHTVFSNFPDFPTVHGMQPSAAGVKVLYRMPNSGSRGETHEIRFIYKDGKLFCQVVDGAQVTTHEAMKGKEITTGWMGGLAVTVEEFYPASEVQFQFEPQPNITENPEAVAALKMAMRLDGEEQLVWLPQGIPQSIQFSRKRFDVLFGEKKIPAGFKLELKDFRLTEYPGTNNPASFESDVRLKDDSRGIVKDVTISMNKPLEHRGFHIYQSGYSQPEGQPEISIFSVGKDPGVPLKYAGALVMVAGILTMFYTRRFSSSGKTL